MHGQWNLGPEVDEYLGNIDLDGSSVLEIGAASGFLTFHMETQGATVTACELPSFDQWDIVPFANQNLQPYIDDRVELGRQLRNAFWLAHAAHESKARLRLRSIYDILDEDESYDIALFGSVLLHVRDPFQAIINAAKHTTSAIVVTDMVPSHGLSAEAMELMIPQSAKVAFTPERLADLNRIVGGELSQVVPSMQFRPRFRDGAPLDTWWQLSPSLIQEFLGIAGFEKQRISYHYQQYNSKYRWANPTHEDEPIYLPVFTIVGER